MRIFQYIMSLNSDASNYLERCGAASLGGTFCIQWRVREHRHEVTLRRLDLRQSRHDDMSDVWRGMHKTHWQRLRIAHAQRRRKYLARHGGASSGWQATISAARAKNGILIEGFYMAAAYCSITEKRAFTARRKYARHRY